METWTLILIAAVGVVAALVIALLVVMSKNRQRARQTATLREGFGPEYAKAAGEQGRSGAEEDLLQRQQRAELFQVRGLSTIEVERYSERWAETQSQFVSDPGAALAAAGDLIAEVIAARGYPAAKFEQGARALSVDHPRAVQNYREAHEVAMRNQRNPVATDDLRTAMEQYQAVFTELIGRARRQAPPIHAALKGVNEGLRPLNTWASRTLDFGPNGPHHATRIGVTVKWI